ncbi:hypothetical protein B0H66DRAFT_545508 [Apodospora peruviana]|uniref:Uncharacterized protein n=1 Tax=Apodospora peruviana TaxID=516989 RepID=A0AAE0ITS5_9PEZI|nr:hypothetical protein B0H66DRAFT_545508 [Apodospora peruviana]
MLSSASRRSVPILGSLNPFTYIAALEKGGVSSPFSVTWKDIHPRIVALARQHNLGLPSELRSVKGERPEEYGTRVAICDKHVLNQNHIQYFGKLEHSLTDKFLWFYTGRPQPPLYLQSGALNQHDGSKAVVRSTARTRVTMAFRVALVNNDYSWAGIGSPDNPRTRGTHLYGTVRILASKPKTVMQLEFQSLVGYFDQLIRSRIVPTLRTKVTRVGIKR